MISKELEITIHQAFIEARAKRHEFITVEHILLSLLDNPSAIEALDACGADIESLRTQLATFIGSSTQTLPVTDEVDTQPTLGFQRVIQRAILQVQASSSRDGRKEVLGVNLLGALFGEKNSHAVYYLHQQGVTRLDVVNFMVRGTKKVNTIPKAWLQAKEKLLKEIADMGTRKVLCFSMPAEDVAIFFGQLGPENFEHLQGLKMLK